MKSIISKIFFISAAALLFGSCKKDEAQQIFAGGTSPVLAASASGTIPLSFAVEDQIGVNFTWTNPQYQFGNGISSQDVTYALEIDKTGNNFTGANKVVISIAKEVGIIYTQKQFNIILSNLKFTVGVATGIDVRIIASINNVETTKLISNTLKFTVTTYNPPPKVAIPSTGVLYIVGDATAGAWNNPVPTPAQQFTKVSATLYEITLPLVGGKQFLFLPLNGDWGHKFACAKTADQSADGGDFGYDFSDNFPGPAASGTYKISIDFQSGKYTVTKQ